jgi:hypothetical protein
LPSSQAPPKALRSAPATQNLRPESGVKLALLCRIGAIFGQISLKFMRNMASVNPIKNRSFVVLQGVTHSFAVSI